MRHFIVYRNHPEEYEIPADNIHILDAPAIWPAARTEHQKPRSEDVEPSSSGTTQRVTDSEFFRELAPSLRPYLSKTTQNVYWRGRISLVDDSTAEIVIAEIDEDGQVSYGIAVTEKSMSGSCSGVHDQTFPFRTRSSNPFLNRVFRRICG